MIVETGCFDARDLKLGETNALHIALKSVNGKLQLDARKWFKFANLDNYIPSKKGLQMSLEDWRQPIPLIQELLDSQK